jgi:thioredoxin 1
VSVVQLTDANFQTEVLEAAAPVLVDVWAQWCGPCRLMAPMMDWLDSEYTGRLAVGKLEADGNPTIRDSLQIQGLPTLILFKGGKPVAKTAAKNAKTYLASECPLAGEHIVQGIERLPAEDRPEKIEPSLHPIELFAKAYGLA